MDSATEQIALEMWCLQKGITRTLRPSQKENKLEQVLPVMS